MKYEIVKANPYNKKPLINDSLGIIIKDHWSQEYIPVIAENNIKVLFLNHALGWSCASYLFLKEIPKMLSIDIIDTKGSEISSIEFQDELVELNLNVWVKETVNFTRLNRIENCFINYNKHLKSIFELSSLKKLYIIDLPTDHELSKLINLEELTINKSAITSLVFCIALSEKLQKLELLDCKRISDFQPIANLTRLAYLNIDGYKDIGSLDFMLELINLEIVLLNVGKINSLKGIERLKHLKALSFSGTSTQIVDGDLSPLLKLEKLSMLMLVGRRHYSHKLIKPWNWKNFGLPSQLLAGK